MWFKVVWGSIEDSKQKVALFCFKQQPGNIRGQEFLQSSIQLTGRKCANSAATVLDRKAYKRGESERKQFLVSESRLMNAQKTGDLH